MEKKRWRYGRWCSSPCVSGDKLPTAEGKFVGKKRAVITS